MQTMKAIRIHSYGDINVLVYEEASCPQPGDSDLLIRVHAASVNPIDWKIRAGYLTGWFNLQLPFTLGLDVSGVVEAVGPGVTGFAVGDAVYARQDVTRDGTYAEYVAVRSGVAAQKPTSIDHLQAAAIPHAALSAWHSLITTADLTAGQTVLIHGAAGGVGAFAVQFAKWRGARVIGTASAKNREFLAELGVDQIVDYTTTRFEDVVHNVDAVLDTVGGEIQQRSWGVLKPGGMLVSLVEPPSQEKAAACNVRCGYPNVEANTLTLAQIASLVDAGFVKPVVSAIFPLHEISKAHALSESLHVRGKIVLQVAA